MSGNNCFVMKCGGSTLAALPGPLCFFEHRFSETVKVNTVDRYFQRGTKGEVASAVLRRIQKEDPSAAPRVSV